MPKSSNPFALSVAKLTVPGDELATFENITKFDGKSFGFSHERTWALLSLALRGEFDPARVKTSHPGLHPRVEACVKALFALGLDLKLDTKRFEDFPAAGKRVVERIDWDPAVSVRVKGTCWYVSNEIAHIPLLLPHKAPLSDEGKAVYLELGRQAYCKGEWQDSVVNLIDLSGEEKTPFARFVDLEALPPATDGLMKEYLSTFAAAKRLADEMRAKTKTKKPKPLTPIELAIREFEAAEE